MASGAIQFSELTVLGTGDLMPALVYGFELTEPDTNPVDLLPDGAPDWLMSVYVQAGGYDMSYYTVLGAVFRFADNASRALQDPKSFLRLFHLMAEAPDVDAIAREFPDLKELCGTWGEPYSPSQLDLLGKWMSSYFALPSPLGGLEAFVRLGRPAVGQMLGWTHLRVKNAPQVLQDGPARDGVTTRGEFGTLERTALCALGSQNPRATEPELYLVWENSD